MLLEPKGIRMVLMQEVDHGEAASVELPLRLREEKLPPFLPSLSPTNASSWVTPA